MKEGWLEVEKVKRHYNKTKNFNLPMFMKVHKYLNTTRYAWYVVF